MKKKTSIWKKILATALTLMLIVGLMPGGLLSVSADTLSPTPPGNEINLSSVSTWPIEITQAGTYYIKGDGTQYNASANHGIYVHQDIGTVNIYLEDVYIYTNAATTVAAPAAMMVKGGAQSDSTANTPITTKVNLYLRGENTLWSGRTSDTYAAGLEIWKCAQVDIYDDPYTSGTGKLSAYSSSSNTSGNGGAAGIGAGNRPYSGGHIVIHSGEITTRSSYHGAGIGDAWGANMKPAAGANAITPTSGSSAYSDAQWLWNGTIFIYGGSVTSTGGSHGAGIGGACYATRYGAAQPSNPSSASRWQGQGTVVVIPSTNPADSINSKSGTGGSAPDLGATGSNDANKMYIGDPGMTAYAVTVETEDKRTGVSMYMDLTADTMFNSSLALLGITDIDNEYVYFGITTGTDGSASMTKNAVFSPGTITFHTDAKTPQGFAYASRTVPVGTDSIIAAANQPVILNKPVLPVVSVWAKSDTIPALKNLQADPINNVLDNSSPAIARLNLGYTSPEDYIIVVIENPNSEPLKNVKVTFPGSADYTLPTLITKLDEWGSLGQSVSIPINGGTTSDIPAYGRAYVEIPLAAGKALGSYAGHVQVEASKTTSDDVADYLTKTFTTTVGLRGLEVTSITASPTMIGSGNSTITVKFNYPVKDWDVSKIDITNGIIASSPVADTLGGQENIGGVLYYDTWTFEVKAASGIPDLSKIGVFIDLDAVKDKYGAGNENRSATVYIDYSNNTPAATFSFTEGQKFWQEQTSVTVTFTANGSANSDLTVNGVAWTFSNNSTIPSNLARYVKVNGVPLTDPSFASSTLVGKVLTIIPNTPFKNNDFVVTIDGGVIANSESNKLAATTGTFKVYVPEIVPGPDYTPSPSDDEFGYGLTANPGRLSHEGGNSILTIHGKYLDYAPVGHLQLKLPDGTMVNPDSVAADGLSATYKATLPSNSTENDVPYLFTLYIGGAQPASDSTATVIVSAIVPSVSDLTIAEPGGTKGKSVTLTDAGGPVDFFIDGYNLGKLGTLSLQNNGGLTNPLVTLQGSGRIDSATASMTFSANKSQQDKVYTFELYDGVTPTGKTVTVTVKKPEMGVRSITATPDKFNSTGGTSTVDLTGLHMDVLTSVEVRVDELSSLNHNVTGFTNNGANASFPMTFPAWTGGLRNDISTLEVYSEGVDTGLTATVEVGDSRPNITGASINPNYYANVEATMNGKGRSVITIEGNYLENFSSIQIYDYIYDTYYTVNKTGCDQTATYTVSVPSAIGVFQYDIWADGAYAGHFVQVGVGEQAAGVLPPGGNVGDPNETRDNGGGNQPRTGEWAGGGGNGGGGSKGGSFTGRLEVGWEVVEYQATRAGKENPKNPQVTYANIALFTRQHFDMAASGAKAGAKQAETVGAGILTVRFDTSTIDNQSKLEGRMYIKLDQPVPDVFPSVYTREEYTKETKALFQNRFSNKNISVIHLDQNDAFGVAEVEIAAAVDLTGMNTTKLYIYRLDRKTGEFELLENTRYYIDTAGYLHFFTKVGGDFIVTDSPLTENGQTVTKGSFPVENMPKTLTPALQAASLGQKQQQEER
ncbi:MAG: hypothetical protein ACK5LX_04775 [Oscillospiraceae bacterium]